MDNKTFIATLASRTGLQPRSVGVLIEDLVAIFKENGSELNSVAVPGVGNFVAEKTDEQIETDPATGERRLLPPAIRMTFKPSVVLRKKL